MAAFGSSFKFLVNLSLLCVFTLLLLHLWREKRLLCDTNTSSPSLPPELDGSQITDNTFLLGEVCPRLHSSLAIVIPFSTRDVKYVIQNIRRWKEEWCQPCKGELNLPIDLIFYLDRDIAASEQESLVPIEEELLLLEKKMSCFRHFFFASSNLPQREDDSRDLRDITFQFFRLYTILKDYSYFFLMEADMVPIQKNWVKKIFLEASCGPDFWIKGSHPRGATAHTVRWNGYHINGNALYNTCQGNTVCSDWVAKVFQEVELQAYDSAIWVSYLNPKETFGRDHFHNYRYTDFVMNAYHTTLWNATELWTTSPNTFLVHGKSFILPNGEISDVRDKYKEPEGPYIPPPRVFKRRRRNHRHEKVHENEIRPRDPMDLTNPKGNKIPLITPREGSPDPMEEQRKGKKISLLPQHPFQQN